MMFTMTVLAKSVVSAATAAISSDVYHDRFSEKRGFRCNGCN